jgi:hypothetical protein
MEIPYIVVHCKRGHRTQFPQETIEPPFEHLADPSKGALSVAVSCGVCKRVENHTIEKRPTHIGTEDTVEYQTKRVAYGFVRRGRFQMGVGRTSLPQRTPDSETSKEIGGR